MATGPLTGRALHFRSWSTSYGISRYSSDQLRSFETASITKRDVSLSFQSIDTGHKGCFEAEELKVGPVLHSLVKRKGEKIIGIEPFSDGLWLRKESCADELQALLGAEVLPGVYACICA